MTEFYERGDYIFVEDLTFWGVSRASKDYGMICVPGKNVHTPITEAYLGPFQTSRMVPF